MFNYIDLTPKRTHWHDLIDIHTLNKPDPSVLLSNRIMRPLHSINPRSILTKIDEGWWDRTRKEVYATMDDHCMCCGTHKSKQKLWPKYLDAHELYAINFETGKVTLDKIVALCSSTCHKAVHFGRLTEEYKKGKVSEKNYYAILSHANTLLHNNNLPKKNWDINRNTNIHNIPWKQWHLSLTINGKEELFYSPWESEEDRQKHYAERV